MYIYRHILTGWTLFVVSAWCESLSDWGFSSCPLPETTMETEALLFHILRETRRVKFFFDSFCFHFVRVYGFLLPVLSMCFKTGIIFKSPSSPVTSYLGRKALHSMEFTILLEWAPVFSCSVGCGMCTDHVHHSAPASQLWGEEWVSGSSWKRGDHSSPLHTSWGGPRVFICSGSFNHLHFRLASYVGFDVIWRKVECVRVYGTHLEPLGMMLRIRMITKT